MLVENKKSFIYWKQAFNAYSYANKDHLLEDSRLIGSSLSGVRKMLSKSAEQKAYMSDVIGISPTSPDWDTALNHYWNSLSVEIPIGGKELEIGFVYDVTDSDKAAAIKIFNESNKDVQFKTDEDIRDYFNKKYEALVSEFNKNLANAESISDEKAKADTINLLYKSKYDKLDLIESEKYKYATPISISDYMLWRYCLGYNHVANEIALVNKSNNIRFYLHSEEEIKKAKEVRRNVEKQRMEAFLSVVKDSDKMNKVMYALRLGHLLDTMDDNDIDIKLNEYSLEHTSKFISTVNMSNLSTVAFIEKLIVSGLLKRLEATEIIVDYTDPTKVIGNTLSEAVSYFSNKENEKDITEYKNKLKGLPKKDK